MRKRLQHLPLAALFAVLLLALAPHKADAQVQIGNFSYTFSGNEATITQCHLSSGAIVFPETVQHGGRTYNVTAIQFTGYSFISGSPTSITGNSIKRITGPVDITIYTGNGQFCSCDNLTAVSFPKLETLSMCGLIQSAPKLTSVSFPLLEKIDGVTFLTSCVMLSSVDLPKLREMYSSNSLSNLPNLATLNLPALTTIKGSSNIQNLDKLTSLQLPVLKVIDSSHSLSLMSLLSTLHLPELERVTAEGFDIFNSLSALTDLKLPKLMLIEGQQFMQGSYLSVIELPYGCEINVTWGSFTGNSSTSLTIKGVTKITDNFFTPHCYSLKHLSLPDVQEISGQIGYYITNIERVDMPNLKKINNCAFFNVDQYNQHLTTVNIPKVTDIKGSNLFEGAPIQELTLSGNITDGGSGQIHLTAYPTVVKIIDAGTVNDNSKIFQDVKGGRLIAPEGEAAGPILKSGSLTISPERINPIMWYTRPITKAGIYRKGITAFNSMSLLSVEFVSAIGGFSLDYPLDMLDHWVYRRIAQADKSVEVLGVEIAHSLSLLDDSMSAHRLVGFLDAERRFVASELTTLHYISYKIRLALRLLKQYARSADSRKTTIMIKALFSKR